MTSWREDKLDVDRVERMTVPELHERWEPDGDAPRRSSTCASRQRVGRGPHPRLRARALPRHPTPCPTASTPPSPVAVICGSGQRAAVAASLLQRYGAEQVIHVVEGGVPLWKREGWPTEQPETAKA